jgi:hypothetical protein
MLVLDVARSFLFSSFPFHLFAIASGDDENDFSYEYYSPERSSWFTDEPDG